MSPALLRLLQHPECSPGSRAVGRDGAGKQVHIGRQVDGVLQFFHSSFNKSQLHKSQDRACSYTGRASYVVFPLGTDCDTPYFRLTAV